MRMSVVLGSVLVILLIPVALLAQDHPVTKIICKETVELSDEQSAKLSESRLDYKTASIKLGAELQVLQLEMEKALLKDNPSRRELELLVSKIGAVKEKLQKKRINHLLELREILEPEQWRKMAACFGGMGDFGVMETCGFGMDSCGTGGGCSTMMTGRCRTVKCMSINDDCCGKCRGRSSCGSFCSGGGAGCATDEGSCKEVERRVKIRCEP